AERVMAVGVMHVGHVRVGMPKRAMLMKMRMRFAKWIGGVVRVPVVRIVHVGMRVREDFVNVLVLMVFGKMQPHAQRHQTSGNYQLSSERFAERTHRRGAA